jgi:hypothetical protein
MIPVISTQITCERRNEFSGTAEVFSWAEALSVDRKIFQQTQFALQQNDLRQILASTSQRVTAIQRGTVKFREKSAPGRAPLQFPSHKGNASSSNSSPEKNISQIAKTEKRHWTTVAKIVKEQDVQEYVEDLRARFYGELEGVPFAVIQYVKNGKDGGWLGYELLKDGGVIPQRDGKHHPAGTQEPVDPQPNCEKARIRMIATAMVEGALARQRFFAESPCRKWTQWKKRSVPRSDEKGEREKLRALSCQLSFQGN